MTAADPWFVCKQIPFKMMPKFLLEAPYREMLKDSAVILYTYMYDLSRLSYQNSRKEKAWVNEKGEVFIRCSLDKVQEVLRCSREKALNEVRSLEKAGLIKRISHGKGRPMDIVLLEPAVGKADSVEFEKPTPQSSENQPGKVRKSNRNHNHAEETELPISIDPLVTHARSEVEEDVKENLCFDILMGEASLDHNSLKGIVKVIVDAVCSKRQVLKISGHEYEIEEVRRTLYALDDMDIRYVLDKIKDMNEPIKYFSGFCLAKLMEAKYASESYYESKVRKDMAAGSCEHIEQRRYLGGQCMNNTVNEIEKLPLYLSADDLEKLLPMSRAGVYNTMHSESFPLVRIGKRMMTPRDDFFAWMKDHIKK